MRITKTISKGSKSQKIMGAIALALGLALTTSGLGSTASASVADGCYLIKATGKGHTGQMGGCESEPVSTPPELLGNFNVFYDIDYESASVPDDTLVDLIGTDMTSGKIVLSNGLRVPYMDGRTGFGYNELGPRPKAFKLQAIIVSGPMNGKILAEQTFPASSWKITGQYSASLTAHLKPIAP